MKIILYFQKSCPACINLEKKLKNNKIKFKKCSKIKIMLEKGFKTVPQLEINGKVLTPQEIEQFLRGEQ